MADKKEKPSFKVETVEEQPTTQTPEAPTETPADLIPQTTSEEETTTQTNTTTTTPSVVPPPTKEGEDSTMDSQEIEDEEKKSGFRWSSLLLFVLGFVLGGLIVGGFFWYKNGVTETATETPTPTPTPVALEETPTPTPEAVDVSELKVNILNGSGTAGQAGTVQALLEGVDFADFETGNAATYDFTKTEVALKEGLDASIYDTIKEALTDYQVKQADDLDEDSDYDIVVTVGSSKTEDAE